LYFITLKKKHYIKEVTQLIGIFVDNIFVHKIISYCRQNQNFNFRFFIIFSLFISSHKINAQVSEFGVNLAGMEFNGGPFLPTAAEMQYYSGKGLKLIRLPFLWEKVQPSLDGTLNVTYLAQMDQVIASAKTYNISVMIDMHNYCRYPYNGTVITQPGGPTQAQYNDVWTKLATHYANETTIWGYDIMNEPNNLNGADWFKIAQGAITSIRVVDANHTIVIEGDNWSHGDTWFNYNDNLYQLTDPKKNLVFEAHQYFDSDGSGTYRNTSMAGNGMDVNSGVNLITPFVSWLSIHKVKGMVGEYGIPNKNDQANWNKLLDNFLKYLQTNCILGTYWAGGPQWGSYVLSSEPTNNFTTDASMMSVLQKYTAFTCALSFTNTRVCFGDSTSFKMVNPNGFNFSWNFNDPSTGISNTSTLNNPYHLFSHPGKYNVELISNVSNPPLVISQIVIVDSVPHVNLGPDQDICSGTPLTIDAGNDYTSYKWQDGSKDQVLKVNKSGSYFVQATNTCGVSFDTINLMEYHIDIPNLITPNNDGLNETLQIFGLGQNYGLISIYNLWGTEIFKSKSYKNDWKAEGLKDGIYYYIFTFQTCIPQNGWIEILK
jgi:endoglucanase